MMIGGIQQIVQHAIGPAVRRQLPAARAEARLAGVRNDFNLVAVRTLVNMAAVPSVDAVSLCPLTPLLLKFASGASQVLAQASRGVLPNVVESCTADGSFYNLCMLHTGCGGPFLPEWCPWPKRSIDGPWVEAIGCNKG